MGRKQLFIAEGMKYNYQVCVLWTATIDMTVESAVMCDTFLFIS